MQPASIPSTTENKEDSALERHSRKCQVCRHPDREAIDEQFVHWVRPSAITRMYGLEWKSLYRHARAVNLVQQRSRNMRSILENVLEKGPEAPVTADAILRTVRAYCACLTDDNRWVDPPTPVVFTTQHQLPQPAPQQPLAIASPPIGNQMVGQTIDLPEPLPDPIADSAQNEAIVANQSLSREYRAAFGNGPRGQF